MSDSPRTRSDVPKRRPLTGRRLLWGLVGAFLVLVLVAAFGAWRTFRAAEETIARHRARLPAEHAALAAMPWGRPPLLEPAQEGEATAVIEAFLKAVEAVPHADLKALYGSGHKAATPEDVASILAAHPEPLAALAPLLHVPSAPPPPPAGGEGERTARFQTGLSWLFAAEKGVRESGDGPAARGISALHLAVGEEMARSGTYWGLAVGAGTERIAARNLVRSMASLPIGPQEARRLRQGLEAGDAARLPLTIALQTGRYRFRSFYTATIRDRPPDKDLGWKRLWSWDVFRAEALDGWDDALDAMASVLMSPNPAAAATAARAAALVDAYGDNLAIVNHLEMWAGWVLIAAMTRADLQVTRVSLAVAEYAATRGRFPAVLGDLVPEFLSAVPLDPWDGAPLRYSAGKVWSIGVNGKDDGGTPGANPNDDRGDGDVVAPAPLVR